MCMWGEGGRVSVLYYLLYLLNINHEDAALIALLGVLLKYYFCLLTTKFIILKLLYICISTLDEF